MDSVAFFVNSEDDKEAQICFEYFRTSDDFVHGSDYLSPPHHAQFLQSPPSGQVPEIMIKDIVDTHHVLSPSDSSRHLPIANTISKEAANVPSVRESVRSPKETAKIMIDDAQAMKTQSPRYMPKIIHDYLAIHESWDVPSFVLFEEPNAGSVTADEFAACADVFCDEVEEPEPEEKWIQVKPRKRGRRYKSHFMRSPMATSEVIQELQDTTRRENALRCLSGHLIEKRELDPKFYRQAGFFLFHSCGTLAILLQEILFAYERLRAGDLSARGSKRVANVLCLLQSIAANDETRLPFLEAGIPNYLIPFIYTTYTEEVYENVRTLSLSVIAILCQTREKEVIRWAVQNNVIELCFSAAYRGNELSKVVAMTILDSILRVDDGLEAICQPKSENDLLPQFIALCNSLVSALNAVHGFSPRLLFLVVRCYILICRDCRALELLKLQLAPQLQDSTFCDIKSEYPIFSFLRHQLLLSVGKAMDYLPSTPSSLHSSPETSAPSSGIIGVEFGGRFGSDFAKRGHGVLDLCTSPVHPVRMDFDKLKWLSSSRIGLVR